MNTSETTCGNDSIFLPEQANILSAEMTSPREKHFKLELLQGRKMEFEPGQIVEAGRFGYGEIPLGFASSPTQTDSFELVVRRVGKVSTALLELDAGDSMTIRGPLGHGFPLSELRGHDVLIVAGGIGLCPTRSLIHYILDRRDEFASFTLMFGSRSPEDRLFKDDLAKWGVSKRVRLLETVDHPDRNWKGNVGVITTLFAHASELTPETRTIICGPPVMYRFVMRELKKLGIPSCNVYVDLERRMKCGVGKCGHCQINDKYVCLDGPVFRYSEIEHLEEAL